MISMVGIRKEFLTLVTSFNDSSVDTIVGTVFLHTESELNFPQLMSIMSVTEAEIRPEIHFDVSAPVSESHIILI